MPISKILRKNGFYPVNLPPIKGHVEIIYIPFLPQDPYAINEGLLIQLNVPIPDKLSGWRLLAITYKYIVSKMIRKSNDFDDFVSLVDNIFLNPIGIYS